MREAIRREFDEMLRVVDALILPVAPCEAPLIATGASRVNGEDVTFASGLAMRQVINVIGLPAGCGPGRLRGNPASPSPPAVSPGPRGSTRLLISLTPQIAPRARS